MTSARSRRSLSASTDPVISVVLPLAVAGAVFGPRPVATIAGLVLVLVLPGLAMLRLVDARLEVPELEYLILTPAISIATAIVTGLALQAVSFRLTTANWAIALGLILVACQIAVLLLRRASEPPPAESVVAARRGAPVAACAMAFVTGGLVAGAFVVAAASERATPSRPFTQLWIVRPEGAQPADAVRIGVRSFETRPMRYTLSVATQGRVVRKYAVTLRPGEGWRHTLASRRNAEVEVTLARGGSAYRRVRLAPLALRKAGESRRTNDGAPGQDATSSDAAVTGLRGARLRPTRQERRRAPGAFSSAAGSDRAGND